MRWWAAGFCTALWLATFMDGRPSLLELAIAIGVTVDALAGDRRARAKAGG